MAQMTPEQKQKLEDQFSKEIEKAAEKQAGYQEIVKKYREKGLTPVRLVSLMTAALIKKQRFGINRATQRSERAVTKVMGIIATEQKAAAQKAKEVKAPAKAQVSK